MFLCAIDPDIKAALIMFVAIMLVSIIICIVLGTIENKKNAKLGNNVSKFDAKFFEWIDKVMEVCPDKKANGYIFNIYDNGKQNYSAEIVATKSFDDEDENWGCDELWASRSQNLEFNFKAGTWELALKQISDSVKNYLKFMEYNVDGSVKTLHSKFYESFTPDNGGVAVGFVDGDIEILHASKLKRENGLLLWVYKDFDQDYISGMIGTDDESENEKFYKFEDIKNLPKEFCDIEDSSIIFEFDKESTLNKSLSRLEEIVKENQKFFDSAVKRRTVKSKNK